MNCKPYDLVRVKMEGFACCGQVISKETPEGTIMVRIVPDDPGTMVEKKVSDLTSLNKSDYKYVQYASVTGSGCFPVDMLRYDFAAPVSFTIEETDRGPKTILKDGFSELIIARAVRTKKQEWTVGRWSSFLWGIKQFSVLKIEEK